MGANPGGAPLFCPPSRPPTAADIDDRDRFGKLADGSLADVRAAAEKWRAGLAALVTLVTGGLLIKGPEAANDLTTGWRVAITVLAGGGIALAVYGLWRALRASAGSPQAQDFTAIVQQYGSVLIFELAQAKKAAGELRQARIALMIALPLLGAAVITWWWADTKPPSPPAYLEVDRVAPAPPICGTLKSGDNGHVRIQVDGEQNPQTIPLDQIQNLRVKASC